MLCILLIDTLSNPLMISAQTVGRVKVYQSVVGGLLLLILPIAYVVLKLGGNPEMVFIVHLIVAVAALVCRVLIVGRMVSFSFLSYAHKVLMPAISVFVLASSISVVLFHIVPSGGILKTIIVIVSTLAITGTAIFIVGINTTERHLLLSKITRISHKIHE